MGALVELVGIPGAGKSRLAQALTADLAARGIVTRQPQAPFGPSVPTTRRLARKASVAGAAAVRSPVTTSRVLRGAARGQHGLGNLAGRLVQWLVAQGVLASAPRDEVCVLDEGPVQALWSMGLRGDVGPVLAALEDPAAWRSPDLLVVVEVPPELALARLAARPSRHSRTQQLPVGEQLSELQRGADLVDRLAQWWAGSAPDAREVLHVSGAGDAGAGYPELLDRIAAPPRV
ncbi:AAA family ATPase [Blastococcus sp. LR1]|uniref:AAA family ATPase n=1 Tax=Blastococcus sp. LR1 TaxID=2877000 RepID=UPI001CCFD38C|nr:AAA family ATPase [Blastococcus sp. LR1]MCA0144864.1 AAA family ATPase [Blastococcus sp. LR1]